MTVPPGTRAFVVNVIDSKPEKSQSIVIWCAQQWKAIFAELVATMLLIIFGCMASIPIDGVSPTPLYTPLAFGFTVMFNVQIFGHLSGAFMNPFVAIIAVFFGKISLALGIVFVIVECIGAIIGYGFLVAVAPIDIMSAGVCTTVPHANIDMWQALGIEIVLSAGLSLINCALWDPTYAQRQDSAAIKFGIAVAGLSIAGGALTGASMNPARSLGPALWTGRWDVHWVYWVGPFIGGIVPALIYKYLWLKKPEVENPEPSQIENESK